MESPNVSAIGKGPNTNVNSKRITRVSKFVPANTIPNQQSTQITNTKKTNGLKGIAEGNNFKRQSTLNYYEGVKNDGRRKTAVERVRDIHQNYEKKRKETWKELIETALGCEDRVERSSCCVCSIICSLIFILACAGIPLVYYTLSSSIDGQQKANENFWSNQNTTSSDDS